MGKLCTLIFLMVSWLGQSVGLAQCPPAVSIRISQVGQPDQLAYNSFCQDEQVQLNIIGDQPGLTYQWKRNGENPPNGTSPTFLAGVSGFYTVTVYGPNKCTLTSLPVSIEANDCQPTGKARIRGGYFDDLNNNPSSGISPNPSLRLAYYTYKADLKRFPATISVKVYSKKNDQLIEIITFKRIPIAERALPPLEAACGTELTQLFDVLYAPTDVAGNYVLFDFDPIKYADSGGYYLVSEGVCCREPSDNLAEVNSLLTNYFELAARQNYKIAKAGDMFGASVRSPAKIEWCINQPLKVDYVSEGLLGVSRVPTAIIHPANTTRVQYSLASPRTAETTPAFRDVAYVSGHSDYNFAGPGNNFRIDPTTGTITGTPTRPGTFVYVVKAETWDGLTRLSEIRQELRIVVKECPPNPQPKLILTNVGDPNTPTSNTFCVGKTAQLNALGGIPGGSWQWQRDGKTIAGATSTTLLVEQEGTYTVSVEKPTACPPFVLSDPLTVTIIAPSVTLTTGLSSGSDCQNTVTQLLASNGIPGATFQWFRNEILVPGISTQTYSTSVAGQYTVQITQVDGCTALSLPQSITGLSPLVAPGILASSTAICPGTSANLSVAAVPGFSYQWLRDGQLIGGATTNGLSATQAGAYTVRIRSANNCTAVSAPARVTTLTAPSIGIAGEAQICQGSSTSLTLSNPTNTAGWQFSWQRNGTTVGSLPVYSATAAGSYRLRITDARGCTAVSSDWLINEVKAITVQMAPLAAVCVSPATPVSLSGSPAGGIFSGSGVTGNLFNPATAGVGIHKLVYTLTGSSSCLSGTTTQSVEVKPLPIITLPARLTTLVGVPVVLPGPAGAGFTYNWTPPLGLSDPTSQMPTANPTQTTTYRLQVRDGFGCLAEASILVESIEPITKIFVPTAFTPNSDTFNDTWKLWGSEGFPKIEVTVFNRWGTVIFHSIGYREPFDGTYKGERIQPGMYTYIIRYDAKAEPLRGTVMVIY